MDGSVYDVFISFRGKDTRLGFTGSLHRALCGKQIKSFMDDHNLEKGAEINPALDNAIQTSRIALVILSKNYASSTFCLDELEKIMECSKEKGMLVLPVFYEVDPCDVRYQKGKYADSLNKHEARVIDEKEKIKEWRFALTKVSHHSGWHFNHDRYEYELIDIIVEDIIKKIHRLRDAEKEKRICNVDEKHVTKPNTVENLVTDPTPRKTVIEEINDMSISGVLNDDSRKMIAAAVLIQRKFGRRRLYRERQAIKIQAAFWGYLVENLIRMTIYFCILEFMKYAKKLNEMYDVSGVLNDDSRKMIAAAVLIQRTFGMWRLYRERQAIKIQSAFRGYQVRNLIIMRRYFRFLEVMKDAKKLNEMYDASGSSRSSLRPVQVPEETSASLCFKAGLHHLELGLDDLELDHVSDAWSCFNESFRLFAKKQKEKARFYFRSCK